MRLNYTDANELFRYLDEENHSKMKHKLGKAINLVDECEATDQKEPIVFKTKEKSVFVVIEYKHSWPRYLIEDVNYGTIILDSAFEEFVRVEIK